MNTPVLRRAIQEEMKKNTNMQALGEPVAPAIDPNLPNLQLNNGLPRNNVGNFQNMIPKEQDMKAMIGDYVSNLPPAPPTRTEEIVDKVKGFTSEALERGGEIGGQALNLGGQALGGLLDIAKKPETWQIAADLGALTNASANPELAAQLSKISGSIGDRIEARGLLEQEAVTAKKSQEETLRKEDQARKDQIEKENRKLERDIEQETRKYIRQLATENRKEERGKILKQLQIAETKLALAQAGDYQVQNENYIITQMNNSDTSRRTDRINEQVNTIQSLYTRYKDPKNSGTVKQFFDQALITMYNKILDPESVVRESEYLRSIQGMKWVNRLKGWNEQRVNGSAGITDEEREELVKISTEIQKSMNETYPEIMRKKFGKMAANRDIDIEDLLAYKPSANQDTADLGLPDGSIEEGERLFP